MRTARKGKGLKGSSHAGGPGEVDPAREHCKRGGPKLGRARKIRKHGGVRGDWRGWIFKHNSTSLEVFSRRAGFKARGPASSKRIIGRGGWKLQALADFRGEEAGSGRLVRCRWSGLAAFEICHL